MNIKSISHINNNDLFNIGSACADKHPIGMKNCNKKAIIIEREDCSNDVITYGDLSKLTDILAYYLIDVGIKKGDRIIIQLPNNMLFPISFLGIMKLGAIAVPVSNMLTPHELYDVLNDCEGIALITLNNNCIKFLKGKKNVKSLRFIISDKDNNKNAINKSLIFYNIKKILSSKPLVQKKITTKLNDPAYMVYTSGTTEKPKGVLHAHRSLLGRIPASNYWFKSGALSNDMILHTGKYNWSFTLGSGLMDPLFLGKSVVSFEGKNNPKRWIELIAKYNCTTFISVPAIYRGIIEKTNFTKKETPTLNHCMVAGEILDNEIHGQWIKRFKLDIYQALGMSEISYYISQTNSEKNKIGSIGKPQPGHKVKILNDDLKEQDLGEPGNICIDEKDSALFLKYWNNVSETKKVKKNGWFITGDYAYKDEEGFYWYLGRKDEIINSFGYRISPMEIEKEINNHPLVSECAVFGEKINKSKTIISIYIKPIIEITLDVKEDFKCSLNQFFKQRLAEYKIPKCIYIVKNIPKTKNGKIMRVKLKEYNKNISVQKL